MIYDSLDEKFIGPNSDYNFCLMKGSLSHMDIKDFLKGEKLKEERIEAGLPFLSPMIGPGYTPDAGLLFALGGLLSLKPIVCDTLTKDLLY